MNVYAIRCRRTGNWWSRNRVGVRTSIPDLYITEANAKRQITAGKIMYMRNKPVSFDAEIVKLKLEDT